MRWNSLLAVLMLGGGSALAGCSVEHNVRRVASIDPSRHGVYYCLPETLLQVQVPITKTQVGKGLLADKVSQLGPEWRIVLTGIPNGDIVETVTYDFGTPVIGTRSRPDRAALFFVDPTSKGAVASELVVELSETGVIASGSSKQDDKTLEYVAKAIEFSGAVAGKAVGFGATAKPDDLQRAAAVAEQIKIIRDEIRELASTTMGSLPRETFDAKVKLLREMEEALMQQFRTVKKTTWTAVFEVPVGPGDVTGGPSPLVSILPSGVRIDRSNHLVNDKPTGFDSSTSSSGSMTLTIEADGGVPGDSGTSDVPFEKRTGFVYRVPAAVNVTVSDGKRLTERRTVAIAQLGPMVPLPAKPGGSTSGYAVAFHADTGGLKKATLSSSPPSTQVIDASKTAATTILDAGDELSRLDREAKELELRLKIRDLEQQLATPGGD